MSYKDHPDMAIAACSKCGKAGQVLVATGQDVAVYNTSGTVLRTQRTRDFVSAAGLTPDRINDPRATWDTVHRALDRGVFLLRRFPDGQ